MFKNLIVLEILLIAGIDGKGQVLNHLNTVDSHNNIIWDHTVKQANTAPKAGDKAPAHKVLQPGTQHIIRHDHDQTVKHIQNFDDDSLTIIVAAGLTIASILVLVACLLNRSYRRRRQARELTESELTEHQPTKEVNLKRAQSFGILSDEELGHDVTLDQSY